MLLVDDYKSEILELDIVLDNGVSANEDVQRAVGKLAVYDVTLLFACGAGEQLYVYPYRGDHR